jgi:tetratricopeptide (TPR) repeat protein
VSSFGTAHVAELLGLPPHRVRAFVRAGFIRPGRGPRNEYRFSFQDLVLLRTAAELTRQRVPARRITQALARLQASLPADRPLSGLRIVAAGDEVVVCEGDDPPWDPRSGQFQIDFTVDDIARPAASSTRGFPDWQPADTRAAQPGPQTAEDWYEAALDLEAVAADDAITAYERALELDPGFLDARINLGRLLHESGQLARAEAAYRRALGAGPHGLAAFNLGVLLEDMDRNEDALHAYQQALAADPQLAEAHYNLARLYEDRGDKAAAIRHFNGYRKLLRRNGA